MLVLGILGGNASAADRPSDVRNYIFGNSLIHHLTTSDETTMPHWLHHLAVAGGKRYAVSGQWGFLRNFEEDLPPIDQWSFKDVPDAWNAEKTPFNKAGFNTILVNTANFIQYQAPDRPYHGENRNRQTPLGATLALIDWLEQQQAGLTYFIYEGWEIMDPFTGGFPPDDAEMKAYHAHNIGDYHDWYEHYLKLVKEARPKIDVRLIPVASILSKLLTQTVLSKLKPADLYSDTGPHGTATTYFLAAVITYSMLYDEKAPEDFIVPDTLHSLVRENYAQIIDVVCKEVVSEGKCG
jgi:hypothetical protein